MIPGGVSMAGFWQDVKYGVRTLGKRPGFVMVAVLTLALGIGANTAIFSVVNGVLLKPLPYPDAGKLVSVYTVLPDAPKFSVSLADYKDFMERSKVFSNATLFVQRDLDLTANGVPTHLAAMGVSNGYFQVLGFRPALGRDFAESDGLKDGGHTVILSDRLWREHFTGDPNVVGKQVTLSGESYTVIGVMPPGVQHVGGNYRSVGQGDTVDIWWALQLWPAKTDGCDRNCHFTNMVGRLRPGVTLEAAQAEMSTLVAVMARENHQDEGGQWHKVSLVPLKEDVVGRAREMLIVVMAAVGFLLLIACVNVANLSLARAAGRQREIAMRVALGASRGRIARQLLAESFLLAAAGCFFGLILAKWGIDALGALAPEGFPRAAAISIDWRVLAFAACATVVTALLFGIAPALSAPQADVNATLKEGDHATASAGHMRLRNVLAVAEIALALVVLVGAGLMARTFLNLQHVNAGFSSDHVLTFKLDVPQARYKEDAKYVAFYRGLVDRLRALPGVTTVGVGSDLPWTGYDENLMVNVVGKGDATSNNVFGARFHFVSPDYFRAIGTPLIAGRFYTPEDNLKSAPVVLVNQALATQYFPGGNAIGQYVTTFNDTKLQIVGIVGDVQDKPSGANAKAAIYFNDWQTVGGGERFIALKTSGDWRPLAAAIPREVAALDSDLPVLKVRPLAQVSAEAISSTRFTLMLVGAFGAIALVLAAVGVFGVISYSVTQRTNEIGIRMALGALERDVLEMIVGQGAKLAVIGVTIGIAAALVLTREMQTLLFNVSPFDPATLGAVAGVLCLVALVACYVPARRAARVDPMTALRHE
jgi:predicted permease